MSERQPARRVSAQFPDLADRVALVSGASRGIGAGIADFLGRQGMKLALTARSAESGQAVADRLHAAGVQALWITADLSTPEGSRTAFEAAMSRFGRVHLLVNNAARLKSVPFLDLDESEYCASLEANVRMVYGLSYLVARHMAEAGGGCIIHISSVGGLRSHRGKAGYDASKGALDALTRSMAVDLAPYGIRVNAVAPGATLNRDPAPPHYARWVEQSKAGIPLGRLATPEDIAAAVAFIASDAGAYITGQVIYVDGGLTAQLTPPGIFI